ncbi:MAG: DUF2247 family protein [Cardiobacteriaceae bacterium]|nr:DUF2247 family protein [Cardiobacteriaceae bacterium]
MISWHKVINKFSIFETYNINANLFLLFLGIKLFYFPENFLKSYLLDKYEKENKLTDIEEKLLSHILSKENNLVDFLYELLSKNKNYDNEIEVAENKLLFIILSISRDMCSNNLQALFEELDLIYANFNYRNDLKNFASYSPLYFDGTNMTQKEINSKLLQDIDDFICNLQRQF